MELLARARRAVADVVTARKRMELQSRQLRTRVDGLDQRKRDALELGQQEPATEATTWLSALRGELAELDRQTAELAGEEGRLRQVASAMDLRVQQLRIRRDTLLAGYEAARARAEVGQVLADVRAGDAELLQAIQGAEQRIARTAAVAGALQGRTAGQLAAPPPVAGEVDQTEEELLWGPAAEERRRRAQEQPPGP
jgi:phage shock protein A